MGQLFMMGFDGTSVSPQIRSLIEDYHLGSVLLSAKNLKCSYMCPPANSLFPEGLHDQYLTVSQLPRRRPDWSSSYRPSPAMLVTLFRC